MPGKQQDGAKRVLERVKDRHPRSKSVKCPEGCKGFVLLPRRWVVEPPTIVIVELRQGDNYYFEEYAIVDSLEVNMREPVQQRCDDTES